MLGVEVRDWRKNACSEDLAFFAPMSSADNRRTMFMRAIDRKKDGKIHTFWSVVESHRVARGRVVSAS